MSPRAVALVSTSAVIMTMAAAAQAETPGALAAPEATEVEEVVITAEEQARQALGASIITEEDIERRPPLNDLSDIIRRQPGVNLTGNSASGAFGNNRQIDLRGMGPENTLILIDGMPVQSRNSVRYGRAGERNTRGDSNWVPAEQVARVEILRGPAAARYGSGAAGGVINIITKGPAETFGGTLSAYYNQPDDSLEGSGERYNLTLTGPIAENLGFRVYGGYNLFEGDDPELNAEASGTPDGQNPPAGREGVENQDLNARIRWEPGYDQRVDFEAGYSRQGNRFAGDSLIGGGGNPNIPVLIGDETNVVTRHTGAINYEGDFSFGTARFIAQYEQTDNWRLNEGLAGGGEGTINTRTESSTAELENWFLSASVDVPVGTAELGHMLTAGVEYRDAYLFDEYSVSQGISDGQEIPGAEPGARSPESDSQTFAAYVEDNIFLGSLTLTPALRYDHHSTFGAHFGPSLNASWAPIQDLTFKAGVARAFKAPNLYQQNPNYLYYTRGNGCPIDYPSLGGGCYIQGNENLEPETSLNKEIGVAYAPEGWGLTLTYFHNEYDDKIVAGNVPVGETGGAGSTGRIFQWTNAPEAVVEGVEGSVDWDVTQDVRFSTNATYMIRNENTETGELLSIIPEYTLNSTLDWAITDRFDLSVLFTRYGEQEPNAVLYSGADPSAEQLEVRPAYDVWGLNLHFQATEDWRITAGVSNLFDERLYREAATNGAGANTYNEPGRAFFISTSFDF